MWSQPRTASPPRPCLIPDHKSRKFMGAHSSIWNESKVRSNAIDRQIKKESRNRWRQINILFLGSDPNRSTIVKQMKIQHGLTREERAQYHSTIYQNILHNAQVLVHAIRKMGVEYADPMNHVRADHILHTPPFILSPEITEDIYQLWQDPIMPKVLDRRDEFYLRENAEYFFKEILRIASPDYLPTDNDISRSHAGLSPLLVTCFNFGTLQVSIIDIGRGYSVRKWIHFFEDAPYTIFCASLDDYDQILQDSNNQTTLADSIVLFECITRSRWYSRTTFILFLTNVDVFKEKLRKIPLARYYPEYTGGANFDRAIEFMTSKFMQANRTTRPVHIIYHPASNTTTAQSILDIVKVGIPRPMVEAW